MFSVAGLKCNCGQFIKPAFQIYKSKITQPVSSQARIVDKMNKTQAGGFNISKKSVAHVNDPFVARTSGLRSPTQEKDVEMRKILSALILNQ